MFLRQEHQYLNHSAYLNASRSQAQSISPAPQSHLASSLSKNSPASNIHPAFRAPYSGIMDKTPRPLPHQPSRATITSPSDTISPLSPWRGSTPISPSLLKPTPRTPSPATISHALPIHNPSALRQSGRVKVVDIPAPLNVMHEVITPSRAILQGKPRPHFAKPIPTSVSKAFMPSKPVCNASAATLPSTVGILQQPLTTATNTTITATCLKNSSPKFLSNLFRFEAPQPSIASPARKYLSAQTAPNPPRPLKKCIVERISDTSRQFLASITSRSRSKVLATDEEAGLKFGNLPAREPTTPLTPQRVEKKDISSPIRHDRLPFYVATALDNETLVIREPPAPVVPPKNPSRSRTRNMKANWAEVQPQSQSKSNDKRKGITVLSPNFPHKEDKEKEKKKKEKENGMRNKPVLFRPGSTRNGRPLGAVFLADPLIGPIHTRISRSKSKIIRDAKQRSRRPVFQGGLNALIPDKSGANFGEQKSIDHLQPPLKGVRSPSALYREVKEWKCLGCGQSWDIHDVIILTAGALTIMFLMGFAIWVAVVAKRNPYSDRGTGLAMEEADGP